MENNTAYQLHMKRSFTKNTVGSLGYDGKCIRKDIVKRFSVCKSFFEVGCCVAQLFIAHLAIFVCKRLDFFYYRQNFTDLTIAVAPDNRVYKLHLYDHTFHTYLKLCPASDYPKLWSSGRNGTKLCCVRKTQFEIFISGYK